MITWLAANAATIIIGVILLAAVIAAIRSVGKKTKSGGCAGCSCGCRGCPGTTKE